LDLIPKYFQLVGKVDKKVYDDILVGPRKIEVVFRSVMKKM
jgi:hypothetical protein